jgi:hypothetical protein
VYIPLLVVSVAANTVYMEVADNFQWIGTWMALVAFASAAAIEIVAYYFPWLDNLLDPIATPLAAVVGTALLIE